MDDRISMCTDVSTENTGMNGSTFSDSYTKNTGVHRGTYMDVCTGNTVLRESTIAYDEYGMHGTKRSSVEPGRNNLSTNTVGMVRKGLSYADALQRTQGLYGLTKP